VRRLLLVTYFFPPLGGGGVPRAQKLAKYLPAFGWAPDVLTVRDGFWSASDATPLAELGPEVAVRRTPILMPGRMLKRALGRPDPPVACAEGAGAAPAPEGLKALFRKIAYVPDEFVGWIPFAVREAMRAVREARIEAILSTYPPATAHLVGRAVAALTRLPWIADFRDPWTRNPSFRHGAGLRGIIERRLERGVLASATRVVTVTEAHREELLAEHRAWLDPCQVRWVPNGFDPDDFLGGRVPPSLERREGIFRLVYTGGWFDDRSPRVLFEALARSLAAPGLPPIEVIVAGTEQALVREEAARAGILPWVQLAGYLPPRDACALQQSADALLLVQDARGARETRIPGKAYQYLATGRPILALTSEGIVADLLRKTGSALVTPTDDPQAAAFALSRMARAWASGTSLPGADTVQLAPYTRRSIAERFAALLTEVARA
jgi:glycosyltransferase involved in cell wall biosynthesis